MKGLMKSNLYSSVSNIKLFAGIIFFIGIIAVAASKAVPAFMINFPLICMVGFSLNAIGCIQKENASRWEKYKLTIPVRRVDIVKSYYLCHIIWLLIGVLAAAFFIGLSFCLYGFLFDKKTDVLMVFTMGSSLALLVGAIFFPLFYTVGSERYEACWTISILGAISIFCGVTGLVNYLTEPMSDTQLVMTGLFFVAVSAGIFALSYILSVHIFEKKEY